MKTVLFVISICSVLNSSASDPFKEIEQQQAALVKITELKEQSGKTMTEIEEGLKLLERAEKAGMAGSTIDGLKTSIKDLETIAEQQQEQLKVAMEDLSLKACR